MCCWPLRAPTPLQAVLWPIIDPILFTFGQMCNFRDSALVTFYLCIYLKLNEEHFTFHLQYKHSGTFPNRKYGELSYPKNQKMCDPILVTLLKMLPHYSQSSRENATPSGGTSPLASYKEVPPPPRTLYCSDALKQSFLPLITQVWLPWLYSTVFGPNVPPFCLFQS